MRKRLASLTAIVVLVCSIFTSNSAMTTFSKSKQITTTSNELVSDENDVEVSNANNAEVGNASASVEGTELDKSAANNVNVNGTMMQYFEWNLPDNGSLWNQIADQADELADMGITALWLPPAYKGGHSGDVGYGVYDLYDLGEFDQKGTKRTKYGTKAQYLNAINKLHANGIHAYADIVLNHKGNADGTENVNAREVDGGNRNNVYGDLKNVKVWTVFNFPGRGNTYSSFKWNYTHFDAVDYDANTNQNKIYLLDGKSWDSKVDNENGNYDYLMYADLDFDNAEVVNEVKSWGKWYVDTANLDGFRLDAVKHIKYSFYKDWLTYLRSATGKELFTVGEFYSNDLGKLQDYIRETQRTMSLFDMPLHNHMQEASKSNGQYDMSKILNGTLVSADPVLAVTFVENHDTQPGQSDYSYVLDWFKPLAYTLILTREGGYPCVFYGDYYGLQQKQNNSGSSQKYEIEKLMKARTACAYGAQHDYFDHGDIVGWTREGDSAHANSGLASIITDGPGGSKTMYVGKQHAGETWYDITGHVSETVTIGSDGCAVFKVNGGSNSVYVSSKITVPGANTQGNNSVTIYYKTDWATPYAHYCVGGGSWTAAPGVKMTKLSDGYYKITVPMGGASDIKMCFNDGNDTWDNNGGNDYSFMSGKYTVNNGSVSSGAPAGIVDPDDSGNGSGNGSGSGSGAGSGNSSGNNGSQNAEESTSAVEETTEEESSSETETETDALGENEEETTEIDASSEDDDESSIGSKDDNGNDDDKNVSGNDSLVQCAFIYLKFLLAKIYAKGKFLILIILALKNYN